MSATLVAAALFDCLFRRIPNAVSLLIFLSSCGSQLCEHGIPGLWLGLQGFWVGLALALPLYLFAGLGGGDVKLLAAGGALLGPSLTLQAAALAAVLGGAMALLTVIASPRRAETFRRWFRRPRSAPDSAVSSARDPGRRRMPMAPALALGMLFVVLQSGAFARIFAVRNMLDLMQCTAP